MQPTSANQAQALRDGTLPEVEEVRPGIYAIALDMPGLRPPYAFSYAILAPGGSRDVHLIDAGLGTDENWEALQQDLGSLDRSIEDVASVTVTHMHHDHLGLAPRIRDASGAVVRLHTREADAIERRATFGVADDPVATLARWGVPESEHEALLATGAMAADSGTEGEANVSIDERLQDGDVLQLGVYEARVIHTPVTLRGTFASPSRVRGSCSLATTCSRELIRASRSAVSGRPIHWASITPRSTGWPSSLAPRCCPGMGFGSRRLASVAPRFARTTKHARARSPRC
ncbi:MBL fold metallo-hydrolase [Leucobacter denitrificans]|uniref:MBL fold metallo-hydrolase n=1 Tax=Leucobacter denitrificans TaxID=683042 RepID=A0A7G9S321_9MICO|nr:MBL fold metallo-hydrolase [Leucobacter denitrificans]QNN62246.1 MBL fold metallo-hydrolase [Leucobacter denitrificans]